MHLIRNINDDFSLQRASTRNKATTEIHKIMPNMITNNIVEVDYN